MSVSAMKQALDLLETSWGNGDEDTLKYWNETAQVLRQAIAEAEDAVAAEREACANVCEDLIGTRAMARHCADAIRARADDDIYDVWVEQGTCQQNRQVAPSGFECPRCGHCCRVDWVGLHEHELQVLEYNDPSGERLKLAKAVEAKLKERNVPQP